jgi:hypothetical protein
VPRCENCATYQRDCTYAERSAKPRLVASYDHLDIIAFCRTNLTSTTRPSNQQIVQLKTENARLREALENLQDGHTGSQARVGQHEAPPTPRLEPSKSLHSTPLTDHSNFHGPSSALFDGEHALQGGMRATQRIKRGAFESIQLLAATAKQRGSRNSPWVLSRLLAVHRANSNRTGQLEHISSRSGELDFDGVDAGLALQMLRIFWNIQHATGSFVYRPCFMRDMANGGPYFSRLLLNAIFFYASQHAPALQGLQELRTGARDISPFRRKAEQLLFNPQTQMLCRSSITTIQALLLLSDALFSWCDERSLSWHYLGLATNMVVDLGLHTDRASTKIGDSCTIEHLESQRRVFWGTFSKMPPTYIRKDLVPNY